MNCKDMEERLIDYIDGELSNEENTEVKDHLDKCSNCQNEYEELKSTIDYVENNTSSIDTSKEIKLNTNIKRRKIVKRFTRTGLIAIALSLILVVSAVATDLFGLVEHWKKSSEIVENAWEELLDNGIGQKLNISTTDKDIKITAEGVISDELNTIILLKVEDLKGKDKYTIARNYSGNMENSAIKLDGDISNDEQWGDSMLIMSDFEPLYSEVYAEDENTLKLMIWTNPLDKEKGNINIEIDNLQIMTSPSTPYMNESEETPGNWNLTIPVETLESKTYKVDEIIDMDGQEVDIKQIIVAPTATSVQYGLNPYNKEKDYYIENISFLIGTGNTIYGKSELGINYTFLYPEDKYKVGEYKIQSLYLQDPKEIDLIINSYKASTKGNQSYTIDYDNLPQPLEYKDNQITIEDIELNEGSTRILIKEDDNKDRRYIKSDIRIIISGTEDRIIEGKSKNMNTSYVFDAYDLESEARDKKGKVAKEGEWSENHYHYVFKQELIIDKERLEGRDFLRPDVINIGGLHYKEFPNSKIRIKLK